MPHTSTLIWPHREEGELQRSVQLKAKAKGKRTPEAAASELQEQLELGCCIQGMAPESHGAAAMGPREAPAHQRPRGGTEMGRAQARDLSSWVSPQRGACTAQLLTVVEAGLEGRGGEALLGSGAPLLHLAVSSIPPGGCEDGIKASGCPSTW